MSLKVWLSALALVSAMGAAGPGFAQDHMIAGKAVPADQVEAVQTKCDELRGAQGVAPATPPAASTAAPATPAPATPAAPAAPAATPAPAAGEAMDLAMLTVEMCDEGGFAAPAP